MRRQASFTATLDLHGDTQDEAYPRLMNFIKRCVAQGHKQVAVITGKGNHSPDTGERGILRRLVPQWLEAKPEIKQTETQEGLIVVHLNT